MDAPTSNRLPPGEGSLELTRVNGLTVVTRARAESPLRLLIPKPRGQSAWIFTGTYGGGLVDGDEISLTIRLGQSTTGLISTQASTKIYRSIAAGTCRQRLAVSIASGSLCVIMPDPLTCFAGARYAQEQRFELDSGASLVALDWLTSGRRASGERWAFARYENETDVFVGGRHLMRDSIRLDPEDGPLAGASRLGSIQCFATLIIMGPKVLESAKNLLAFVNAEPPQLLGSPLLFSASPLEGGALIRVAGIETEQVGWWLRDRLDFLPALFGHDPWARKW